MGAGKTRKTGETAIRETWETSRGHDEGDWGALGRRTVAAMGLEQPRLFTRPRRFAAENAA